MITCRETRKQKIRSKEEQELLANAITKALPEDDLEWMEEEAGRLRAKGVECLIVKLSDGTIVLTKEATYVQ